MEIVKNMKRTLYISLISQLYCWKSMAVYRTQFIFQILYSAIGPLVTYFFISIIYTATAGIHGWSFYQLLFLSSLIGVVSPLVSYIITPATVLRALRRGTLDTMLLRPYSAFTALMSNYGDPSSGLAAIDASILTIYAGSHLSITVTGMIEFMFLLTIGIILLSIFSLTLVMLFYKLFRSGSTFQSALNAAYNYGQYPLSIYGFPTTLLLTLIVPIGFATYIPAEIIIGALNFLDFIVLSIVAILLMVILYKIINKKLDRYTSAMG